MKLHWLALSLLLPASCALAQSTPPMGWNSWDSYGTTIDEQQVRANADAMAAKLKPYGWQYIVVDMEWFVTNPIAEGSSKTSKLTLDANGRYMPAPNRFPTSADAAGFAPLAAYVHSLGLKFGIHILQGIPKEAVAQNLPIAGSPFHAADAANTAGTCPWNPDNYDLKDNPAGQAYYDSIATLYAKWGVDLIKIDCIASRPFKADEVRMFHKAVAGTGRTIAISLSPGEPPIDQTALMQDNATQWRVSNDIWDMWHSKDEYPQGLGDQFPRAQKWLPTRIPGHWPDLDMLALGRLGPTPGWGKARDTQFTHDEQRTLLTLWSIFRSPLMMGGDLPALDPWTLSLLTNPAVIDLDQNSHANKCVLLTPTTSVWTALPATGDDIYVALFNLTDQPTTLHYTWNELGLPAKQYSALNLWENTPTKQLASLSVPLAPHASILLRVTPKL
jgi:alpha-galactosidase